MTKNINIGLIGAGYMGKAHAVALQAVGAVFNTNLRPRCEMIATSNPDSAKRAAAELGFARHSGDWRELVADDQIAGVVIASPQNTHSPAALAALKNGKPVFCEKPLAMNTVEAEQMVAAANTSGVINMIGFNYVRTPATQYVRQLLQREAIGTLHYLRCEHTEDFSADVDGETTWRSWGEANGTLGDLAPHMINTALALGGDITALCADYQTVHPRGDNDDQAHLLCRFGAGAMGHLFFSRVAHGRKMGYAYELHGSHGTIRFDQEDQNSVWLYRNDGPLDERGFKRILTGPEHPDYQAFCQGAGHGTGYQDQMIIEMRDFLQAIETGVSAWPDFSDGLAVHRVIDAIYESHKTRSWVAVGQ